MKRGKHSDGTRCLRGSRRVPKGFKRENLCCNHFGQFLYTCARDLRFEWYEKSRSWMIVLGEEVGGGGIAIDYCPFCGKQISPPSCDKCNGTGAGDIDWRKAIVYGYGECPTCKGTGKAKPTLVIPLQKPTDTCDMEKGPCACGAWH